MAVLPCWADCRSADRRVVDPFHTLDYKDIAMGHTPIKRLSRANVVIQQGLASFERVKEVLLTPLQIVDSPDAYPLPRIKGHVQFVGVSFSYNETRPVLHDVNFEARSSEMLALVGLSGSGKTTIINLLSRFYEPSAGKILIDGIDIREVTLSSLRSQIGLVTQELILFNDTVRNNIAYGLDDIPMSKVTEAAKAANAHDFISSFPDGYDTLIGDSSRTVFYGNGGELSANFEKIVGELERPNQGKFRGLFFPYVRKHPE